MIVVTGMGVVSPIGVGAAAFWDGLSRGAHAIRDVARFDTSAYDAHLAATIPEDWFRAHAAGALPDPCAAVGTVAAREALASASIGEGARVGLVVGTSAAGLAARSAYELAPGDPGSRRALLERSGYHVQTAAIADAIGARGPRLTISSACASATHALAHARHLLESGEADVVLAGGVDVLVEELFAGFHAMGAMSTTPCAPFGASAGMSLGEGAGFVTLETRAHAAARNAEALCAIAGTGSSADAWHATAPEPSGRGIARAVRAALAGAGLAPDAIGYVNAHGTGTSANDAAEWAALRAVFGESIAVSSTKSYFGHALGAAGALELIATILCMRRGVVPPTLGAREARARGPRDVVAEAVPRPHVYTHALSTSLAFGGANAAVIVGPADAPEAPRRHDDVVVLGAASIARAGRIADDALVLPRHVDPRTLDRASRLIVAAASRALDDAQLAIRGELRDRAGVMLGAPRLSWEGADEFWGSIRARGFARASAPGFARIVLNAPAGALSRALSLGGPLSVIGAGPCSGVSAFVEAASALSGDDACDLLLTGSSFELAEAMRAEYTGEAAACFVLARASFAAARGLAPIARVKRTFRGPPGALPRDITSPRIEAPTAAGTSECLDALAIDAAIRALKGGARAASVSWNDPLAGAFAVELVCSGTEARQHQGRGA